MKINMKIKGEEGYSSVGAAVVPRDIRSKAKSSRASSYSLKICSKYIKMVKISEIYE